MSLYIGIDLGTTNSTVTVIPVQNIYRDDPLEVMTVCPVYQYGDTIDKYETDKITLPSAIYFDIDKKLIYTGTYAKKIYASGDRPLQTIRSIKTRIGGESMIEVPSVQDEAIKMSFDMVQCSSVFIRTIRQSLQHKFPNEALDEVVVTVPAAFDTDERQATINAVLLGGFKKCHILDEPTAALLYYINSGDADIDIDTIPEEGEYKLVYDIGGGTLDVCIAKVMETDEGDVNIDIIARSNRMNLGGDDFDKMLAAHFLTEFEKVRTPIQERSIFDQNRIISRLVSQAEDYKINMNDKIKMNLDNPRKLERVKMYPEFELTDNMFVDGITLTKSTLDQLYCWFTDLESGQLIKPVKHSLLDSKLKKSDIKEIIITGGMSNFYAVTETLRQYFGREVRIVQIDSVTAVSKGAALHHYGLDGGAMIKNLQLKDMMADNIYIKVEDRFDIFIPKEMQASKGVYEYKIPVDDILELPVFLYAGIDEDCWSYKALSGKFIPLIREYKKGEIIHIAWSIDGDKVIHLNVENEKVDIKSSKNYTQDMIDSNVINSFTINRG